MYSICYIKLSTLSKCQIPMKVILSLLSQGLTLGDSISYHVSDNWRQEAEKGAQPLLSGMWICAAMTTLFLGSSVALFSPSFSLFLFFDNWGVEAKIVVLMNEFLSYL